MLLGEIKRSLGFDRPARMTRLKSLTKMLRFLKSNPILFLLKEDYAF